MSILTDILPESVEIAGRRYPVRSDFKVWLEFDKIMGSNLDNEKKFIAIKRICFDSDVAPPPEVVSEELIVRLMEFYNCGRSSGNFDKKGKGVRVIDFEEDSELIYAAFLAEYGLDLLSVPYLHWFCFCALFRGLGENNKLSKIMSYRAIDLDGIKDPKRREQLRRLKQAYALSDNRNKMEMDEDIALSLLEVF